MKIHQQFDLNQGVFNRIKDKRASNIKEIQALVEKLIQSLVDNGYVVIHSSTSHTGIPQNITVIKDFTGNIAAKLSATMKHDFDAVSSNLGIERLFE